MAFFVHTVCPPKGHRHLQGLLHLLCHSLCLLLTCRILSEVCKACAALIYPSSPPRSLVPKDIPWSQFWIPKGPEHRDWPNDDSLVSCMLWFVSSGVLTSHPASESHTVLRLPRDGGRGTMSGGQLTGLVWASANSPVMGKSQPEGHRAAPAERWRAARDPPTPLPDQPATPCRDPG